jgi:hypothetical protein
MQENTKFASKVNLVGGIVANLAQDNLVFQVKFVLFFKKA